MSDTAWGSLLSPLTRSASTRSFTQALFVGVASVVLIYFILRSKLGLGLMAMRDDETSSETMGVDIFRTKLICFVLAAG